MACCFPSHRQGWRETRADALQQSPRPQPTALKSQALAQTSERGTRSTALGKNQSCNLSPWAKQSSLNNIFSVRDLSGHIFGHICPSRALLQDFSSESRAVSLGSTVKWNSLRMLMAPLPISQERQIKQYSMARDVQTSFVSSLLQ